MELYEGIISRRSVRRFRSKEISQDIIDNLLKAAMHAPSAANEMPWEFVVVRDVEALKKVAELHPYAQMAADAPLGVLVCGNLAQEKLSGNWVLDCSAATQNLLLAAHAKGVGGCWCGVYPEADRVDIFKKLFSVPDGVIPFSFVVLGYPLEEVKQTERFDASRIHLEKWTS